jgi:glutathione S-transferase
MSMLPGATVDVVERIDRRGHGAVDGQSTAFAVRRAAPEERLGPHGLQQAREMLATSYAWLDNVMATRKWAAGDRFSLADCAAAPFLFYADSTHSIGAAHPNVTAYRERLLQRPSFARCRRGAAVSGVLSARRTGPRLNRPSAGVGAVRARC